jgi:hypothetical protein
MTDRTVLALAVAMLFGPTVYAQPQVPSSAMERAGLVPGQSITVTLRPSFESAGVPVSSEIAGRLVDFDSAGITLRLDDNSERRITRDEALRVVADAGRSRWRGLFAGLVASLPVYAFVCQNKSHECDEGGVAMLVGEVVGAIVGWPQTTEVHFP